MLGLFVDVFNCTSGINRLALTSVTDNKSYVSIHQFIASKEQVTGLVHVTSVSKG